MFRRKEEGLFDTDVLERADDIESINVISPAANATANASTGFQSISTAPSAASNAAVSASSAAASGSSTAQRPSVSAPASAGMSNPYRPTSSNSAVNAETARPAARPNTAPEARSNTASSFAPASQGNPSATKVQNRVLTVGNDILLKGEIATCDRLVIEGKVEASLNDVHTVELAECGTFKGVANVVDALISGEFEGDLVCTGKLIVYSSGRVHGKITYGEVEIERGGELTGEIKTVSSAKSSSKAPRKEAA